VDNYERSIYPLRVYGKDEFVSKSWTLTSNSDDSAVRATRRTLQLMGQHPRLDTAVLETVRAKNGMGSCWCW
jgi:hypothetical protein